MCAFRSGVDARPHFPANLEQYQLLLPQSMKPWHVHHSLHQRSQVVSAGMCARDAARVCMAASSSAYRCTVSRQVQTRPPAVAFRPLVMHQVVLLTSGQQDAVVVRMRVRETFLVVHRPLARHRQLFRQQPQRGPSATDTQPHRTNGDIQIFSDCSVGQSVCGS